MPDVLPTFPLRSVLLLGQPKAYARCPALAALLADQEEPFVPCRGRSVTPSVRIRPLQRDDHPEVGRLLLAAYDAAGPFDDDYRMFLSRPEEWAAGTSAVLVAEIAGRVAGSVAYVVPGDAEFEPLRPPVGDAGFRFLAVDPTVQGTGAGRALVEACIALAREQGRRRIIIHSMAFMTPAHRLYERLGFDRRPDLDVVFPSGAAMVFTLDLVPDAAAHFPPPGPVPDEPPWYEDAWGLASEAHDPMC